MRIRIGGQGWNLAGSRTAALLLVVTALATTAGPAAAQVSYKIGHAQCCGRQDVILIRGGAGYWPGANDLAKYLTESGYVPTVTQHWEYADVADEITKAVRQGRMAGGVAIVGYSSGADSACLLAERLKDRGIRVNTLVLIESTFGYQVPSNVDYCVNFYEPRSMDFVPAFRGLPVRGESHETTLVNVNVANNPELRSLANLNHFTLGNSHHLHHVIGGQVASRQPAQLAPVGPQEQQYYVQKAPAPSNIKRTSGQKSKGVRPAFSKIPL